MSGKSGSRKWVILVGALFLAVSCAKTEEKTEEKKILQSSDSLQLSISGLDSAISSINAIRTSVSAVNSAKNAQGGIMTGRNVNSNMITGRIITGRAPSFRSPKFIANKNQKAPSLKMKKDGRIKTKQSDEICQEYEDEYGSSIALTLSNESKIYIISKPQALSEESSIPLIFIRECRNVVEGVLCEDQIFSSCSNIPEFDCSGIDGDSDILNFVNSVTNSCGLLISSKFSSYTEISGVSCSLDYGSVNFGVWEENKSAYITITQQDNSVYVNVSYCNSQGICGYAVYNCGENLFTTLSCDSSDDLATVPEQINYVWNNLSSCKEISSGVGTGGETGDYCNDWDNDGKPDGISITLNDGKSISIEKDENGYLRFYDCEFSEFTTEFIECNIYVSSQKVGTGNCKFIESCGNPENIDQKYLSPLSSSCGFQIGGYWRLEGENFEGCLKDTETGEYIIYNWYQNSGTSIIVQTNGYAEKYECQTDKDNNQLANCEFYSAQGCTVQNCEVSCKSNWEGAGYSISATDGGQEKFCGNYDINEDGKKELILGSFNEQEGKGEVVAIRSDGFSVVGSCNVSTTTADIIECKIKTGKCQINSCPSSTADISSIISGNCQLSDYASCKGEEECEGVIFGFLTYEKEESGSDVISCSKVINTKTGEFVKIRKVKDGYEYTKGTTESFFQTICPANSKVDFEMCAISGCEQAEKSADIVSQITNFVDETTKQVFSLRVSDTKKGISGDIQVEYYKNTGEMKISGILNIKETGTLTIDAFVKSDGSVEMKFTFKSSDGKEIKGDFVLNPDGSGRGIIQEGDKEYTLELYTDGTGKICEGSTCETFST